MEGKKSVGLKQLFILCELLSLENALSYLTIAKTVNVI